MESKTNREIVVHDFWLSFWHNSIFVFSGMLYRYHSETMYWSAHLCNVLRGISLHPREITLILSFCASQRKFYSLNIGNNNLIGHSNEIIISACSAELEGNIKSSHKARLQITFFIGCLTSRRSRIRGTARSSFCMHHLVCLHVSFAEVSLVTVSPWEEAVG